jgi:homoserine dehydrogenase
MARTLITTRRSAHPTGVAVVSDLMRVAREIGPATRKGFRPAHAGLGEYCPIPITLNRAAYYLRFRVKTGRGLSLNSRQRSAENISIEAVLQLPDENAENLPFVITVERSSEASIRAALGRMQKLDFFIEPPLAMPMETSL